MRSNRYGYRSGWLAKKTGRPNVRVQPRVVNPSSVEDGYRYLRLDLFVVNKGGAVANSIVVQLSAPTNMQTVADYFKGRQPFTPGEGELNMSTAEVGADGYRRAAVMLPATPLPGGAVVALPAGIAVVYARNGTYVFKWSAHCSEDGGRGTSGTFTVVVADGAVDFID
jgi:hypothetical protein